jgi:hypothetical protein
MPREDKGSSTGSPAEEGKSAGTETSSLAARRARLRGSLAKAPTKQEQEEEMQEVTPEPQADTAVVETVSEAADIVSAALSGFDYTPSANPAPSLLPESYVAAASPVISSVQADSSVNVVPAPAMDLLNNIDQAMNACATNLAALQNIAREQTTVLQGLTDTLQNQTLFEIGLNLNSLTESLSAALEPMKAVGELVPAIDQLVAAMEERAEESDNRVAPDQLVMNLADQLSSGAIDPWTFKCAYMAVFPADHPADLLRRLVELLGTQRLSGELFRSAYEAVQAAEPSPGPTHPPSSSGSGGGQTIQIVQDEKVKEQLENLRQANEELAMAMNERQREFENLLSSKDKELEEVQNLLADRYQEYNDRYEEVTEALNRREQEYRSLLENKDMVLTEKESELNLLKAQMEELRLQTQDMVKDLQKQMADVKIAKEAASVNPTVPSKPLSSAGFFDTVPQASSPGLFDTAPYKPLLNSEPILPQPEPPQPVAAVSEPQPSPTTSQDAPPAPPPPPPPEPPANPAAPAAVPPAQQAVTRSQPAANTAAYSSGSGSYGSGVRAQVFEVIVRQALAGAPWREICAGPMQVNNISPDEVEAEVKRRQALLNK